MADLSPFGASLATHPYEIGRTMLVVFNLLPLLAYFVLLACLVERFGTSDWGRMFTMAAATFGTLLTTFAVAINNHLPAAVCTAAAVYAAVRLVSTPSGGRAILSWPGFRGAGRGQRVSGRGPAGGPGRGAVVEALAGDPLGFLPAVLVVAARFRHQLDRPRQPQAGLSARLGQRQLVRLHLSAQRPGGRKLLAETRGHRPRRAQSEGLRPERPRRPSRHLQPHAGLALEPRRDVPVDVAAAAIRGSAALAAAIFLISAACLTFYLLQPQLHRNYGGVSSGLRWLFWLAPLWLLTMLPAADALARRRGPAGSAWCCWPSRPLGQLPDLESLDGSLVVRFSGGFGGTA